MKLWISLLSIFGLLVLSGFAVVGDGNVAYASTHDATPTIVSASFIGETYIELEISEPIFDNNNIPSTDFTVLGTDPAVTVTLVEISDRTIGLRLSPIPVTALADIRVIFSQSGSSALIDADGNRLPNYSGTAVSGSARVISCNTSNTSQCFSVTDGGFNDILLRWIGTIPETEWPTATFDNVLSGATVDSDDNIYMFDAGNTRVLKFDKSNNYVSQFRNENGMDSRQLHQSGNVAINSTGHAYIVNEELRRFLIYNPDGSFNSPDDGRLSGGINDIEIAPDGHIYVSDTLRRTIYVYNSDNTFDRQFGEFGRNDSQFLSPESMAINSTGFVYIADNTGNHIQIFDSDDNFIAKFGVDGLVVAPRYMSADAKSNIYVAESIGERFLVFDRSGKRIAAFGSNGTGIGEFLAPRGVAVNSLNNLYIADAGNKRIDIFTTSIPTVKLQTSIANPTNATLIPFTIQFGDSIYGFEPSDITTTSGAMENFSVDYDEQAFGSFGNEDGQLRLAHSIALDAARNIYVTVAGSDSVQIFNNNGIFLRKFGGEGTGNGQFTNPAGIAIDSSNKIYVTDTSNHRVQIFNSDGTYQSQFGSEGSGNGQFDDPLGIALNSNGHIYVSERDNHRVQVFNNDGTYRGQFGSQGSDPGKFSVPVGIAIDSDDNVYVADFSNNRIQIFNPDGTYQGQFGNTGPDSDKLVQPSGIVIDVYDNIYVTDSANNRIQIFDNNREYQNQIGLTSLSLRLPATPVGITIDLDGNIYVVEAGNNRINIITPQPSYTFNILDPTDQETLTVGVPSDVASSNIGIGNSPHAISIGIDRIPPIALSADALETTTIAITLSEPIYGSNITPGDFTISDVATSTTVTAVDISGSTITLTLSVGITDSDDTPLVSYVPGINTIADAAANQLVAFSNLAVTNNLDTTVPGVTLTTNATDPTKLNPIPFTVQFSEIVTGFDAGDITRSSGTIQSFTSDTSSTISYLQTIGRNGGANGEFRSAYDVAVNSTGYLYVVELNGARVQIFDSAGQYVGQFGGSGTGDGQFSFPSGIAIDSDDNVYIADQSNHRIQKFTSNGTYQSQFGEFGTSDGRFSGTIDIAINSTDHLFVADFNNDRIQIFDSNGTYQAQFGSVVDGTGDGQFNSIRSIAIGSDDSIYVTDGLNHRVQIFAHDGTYQRQFASVVNGPFNTPHGIALDSDDNIYVADGGNHRILVFGNDGTYQGRFGDDTRGSANDQFNGPRGITIDSDDNIYVAENSNHRVQKLSSSQQTVHTFDLAGPTDQETLTVSIAANVANDAASLGNNASNVVSLHIDRTAPTVSSATTTSTTSITLTLSESVSGTNIALGDFVVADVSSSPTVSAVVVSGSTVTLTLSTAIASSDIPNISYTPSSNAIVDGAGNTLAAFTARSITNNLTTPTVNLSTSAANPTNLVTIPFTAQFSENVLGFTTDDISASSGTIQNLVSVPTALIKTITTANSQNLSFPRDVEFDSLGNFYVTDADNSRVIIFDGDGEFLREFQTNGTSRGLAINSTDHIFVTNIADNSVLIYRNDGTFLNEFGINPCGESDDSLTDSGIAVDSGDNLYVSNSDNNCINIHDSNGEYIDNFGGSGSANGTFNFPVGLTLDSDDEIYVADKNNNRIQIFNSTTYEYIGQFGSTGSGNEQFDSPTDITIGTDGSVYITDTSNNRIQVFDSQDNYITTFTRTTPGGALDGPAGIAIGANNHLYVTESSANRIRIFSSTSTYTFDISNPTDPSTLNVVVPSGAAQNANSVDNDASNTVSISIDRTAPAVTTASIIDPSAIRLVLSEPVFANGTVTPGDFTITGIAGGNPTVTGAIITNNTNTVTLTVSPSVSGTDTAPFVSYTPSTNRIFDAATNQLASFSNDGVTNTLDSTRPIATFAAGVTSPTNAEPIPFTLTFSEQVTGFSASDITVSSGTVQNLSPMPAQSTTSYTFNVVGSAGGATLSVSMPAGVVQDTDNNANAASTTVSVSVDRTAPTVTATSVTAPSTIQLVLSEPVFANNVVTPGDFTITGIAGGNPTVTAVTVTANTDTVTLTISPLISGTDTAPLVSYTPSTNRIADAATNPLASFSDQGVTNTLDPTMPIATFAAGVTSPTNAEPIPFTLTFSEQVTGFTASDITVSSGTVQNLSPAPSQSSTSYTFNVAGSAGGATLSVSMPAGAVQDTDNNGNTASIPVSVSVDRTAPIVTATSVTAPSTIQLVLSEPVFANNVVTPGDFTITGVTDGNPTVTAVTVTANTNTFTLTISPSVSGTDTAPLVSYTPGTNRIADAAANPLASFNNEAVTNTLDSTRPVVTIATIASDPTNAEPIPFTLTFSEQVTGFTASDITVSSGTVQNLSPAPSQSALSYAFTVVGSADGTTLSVSMSAGMVQDTDNNANAASIPVSVSVDRTAPTVTATSVTAPSTIQLVLSEPVFANNAVTPGDFTITGVTDGNPTVTAVTVTANTNTFTLTISPPVSGSDTAPLVSYTPGTNRIADAAANPLASFNNQGVTNTLDSTMPVVTITAGVTSPTNAEPIPFTLTFSEQVTGFSASDITVSSGTVQNISPTPSPSVTSYTFNVAGSAGGAALSVSMSGNAVQDTDNNANAASTTVSVSVDRTAPTVTATSVTAPSTIQLVLSEPVFANNIVTPSDFAIAGVAAGNPTVTAVTVTANTNTVTLTLSAPISATDTAPLVSYTQGTNRIADAAANPLASFSNRAVTNTLDPSIPTVTLTTVVTSPTGLNLIPFTVQFSENVSGFDTGDITISSGTIQNLTPASPSPPAVSLYTFNVVNPTDQATLTVIIPAGAAQNANIVGNAASNPITLVIEMDTIIRPTPPTRSGGGGGGGESIPPSLTTSFDDDFESITINNVGISPNKFNDVYMQSPPISASTGVQTPIQIVLYENISWNLVSHVELCMNKAVVANQVCYSDTKVIWDKSRGDNSLEIIDPNNLINDDNTTVDRSKVNDNVVTFDFDIEFVDTMKVSDLRIYAWDTNRNALVYTVENAFKVISGSSSGGGDGNIVVPDTTTTTTIDDDDSNNNSNSNNNNNSNNTDTTNNDNSSTTSPVTLDRELLKRWTGFASESMSDAEFLTHAGIYNKDSSNNNSGTFDVDDDMTLPNWTKNMVGKWALQGKISTVELKATLSYMHKLINDEKH